MPERGAIVGQLCVLGGARAPLDAFVEATLPVLDARGRELSSPALDAVATHTSCPAPGAHAVPVERLRIAPQTLAEDSLLAHQARLHEPVLA